MKNTCSFYIVFQVLKVFLIKICKIQPLDLLFLVAFISFYISRYHFSQLHSTLSEKKIFVTNFPFLTDSPKVPTPLQLKRVTKVFFVDAPLCKNYINYVII